MKNWLKPRKGSTEVNRSDISLPLQTERIDSETYHPHAWNRMSATETSSIVSESDLPPSHKPPSVYTELKNSTNKKNNSTKSQGKFNNESPSPETPLELNLLSDYTSSIQSCKSMIQRKVLISSEHYFRLALESYEQLRAVHYRASMKFSLAEWLHIHALLLYGRIQQVQSTIDNIGSVNQHNKIDLGGDISIFSPIATALNAIGTVEDTDNGVLYIPDAVFPQRPSSDSAYSTAEMQQILNGILYDWQRSWGRVLEARYERDSRDSKLTMTRSSSELMVAIRDTANSIDRIRMKQQTIEEGDEDAEEFVIQLANKERSLNQLFEEARNAKDYTIRPPCNRVYSTTESVKSFNTSASDESSNEDSDPSSDQQYNNRYSAVQTTGTMPKVNKQIPPFDMTHNQMGGNMPRNKPSDPNAHHLRPQVVTNPRLRNYRPMQPRPERIDPNFMAPQKLDFLPQKLYQNQLPQKHQLLQQRLQQQQAQQQQAQPQPPQLQQGRMQQPRSQQIETQLPQLRQFQSQRPRSWQVEPQIPQLQQPQSQQPQSQHPRAQQPRPQQPQSQQPEEFASKKSPKLPNQQMASPPLEPVKEKSRFDTYPLNGSEVSLLTPPDTSVDSDVASLGGNDVTDDSTAVEITSKLDTDKELEEKLNSPYLGVTDEEYCGEITDDEIEGENQDQKQELNACDDEDDIKSFITASESKQDIPRLDSQRSQLFTSIPPFEPLGSPTGSQKSQLLPQSPLIPQSPLLSNHNFSNISVQPATSSNTDLPLNNNKSNLKVKIGGSSESLDQFVHYDAQLWANYTTFIDAIRNAGLADFRPMSKTYTGNFAWVLPVKVNVKSPNREVIMKLPHKSVSKEDQVLALVLQTCHDGQEPMQSWHNQVNIDINIRSLLSRYIATAVDDRTRN